MGLVINGRVVDVPGVSSVTSFKDDKKMVLRAGEDMRIRRTSWVRSIVLHTTKGIPGGKLSHIPQKILPGLGPNTDAESRIARMWSTNKKPGGAHLICDFDASWGCLADLATDAAFHAKQVNDYSIGIEIFQGSDAEMYEEQLDSVVVMLDFLTWKFKIQRQYQRKYYGRAIPRLLAADAAASCVGIFGHRDCSNNRGEGDPGDRIFEKLGAAGYEPVDFEIDEDRNLWRLRQQNMGIEPADGIAGPGTAEALLADGKRDGMWVQRPYHHGADQ